MLTLQNYQAQANETNQKPMELEFSVLGLFGEVGSLLSEAKKKQRDDKSYVGYEDALIEELGDVTWYLAQVATSAHLQLADIAANIERDNSSWTAQIETPLAFRDIQQNFNPSSVPSSDFEKILMGLARDAGNLVSDVETGACDRNQSAIAAHLVRILRSLIITSNSSGVSLEQAAEANLAKIFDRWPRERIHPPLLDEQHLPEYERLPRHLTIDIIERDIDGKTFVVQRCNDLNIGDRLTDNILVEDDYRFHDVFHYAHAAILGWSPVVRALLKIKRKSVPETDEAQDGARATLLEEGVTAWIFNQAKGPLNHFEGLAPGEISFDLLKAVRKFVRGYEIESCPLWVWEEAILQGYAAFRYLRNERSGRVTLDLESRTISIGPIE